MAKKALILLIVLSLLLSLSMCIGCGDNGNNGDGGNGEGGADMISMMKKQANWEALGIGFIQLSFWDVDAVRTDDDLEAVYESSELLRLAGENFSEETGLDWEDVDCMLLAGVALYEGDFDLDDARDWLEGKDYDETDYMGVGIWERDDSYPWPWAVALMSNVIIQGEADTVRHCIEVIEGGEDSLYDDRDVKDVVDRLPSGFRGGLAYDTHTPYESDDYSGVVVSGFMLAKHASDVMKVTTVFKFEDETAAEDAVDNIRYDMEDVESDEDEEWEWRNISVTRDGQLVTATAEVHGAY